MKLKETLKMGRQLWWWCLVSAVFALHNKMKMTIFWVKAPRSLIDINRHFRRAHWVHHQWSNLVKNTLLKVQSTGSFWIKAGRTSVWKKEIISFGCYGIVHHEFNSSPTKAKPPISSIMLICHYVYVTMLNKISWETAKWRPVFHHQIFSISSMKHALTQ